MHQPDYSISTPENVDLHLEIAGLGNRLLAQLIDGLILLCVIIVIVLVGVVAAIGVSAAGMDSKTRSILLAVIAMVAVLTIFVIQNGYFLIFEGVWHGQTPGKKLAEIRVIEQNGQPIGWPAAIIRNLMRLIDSFMFLGILVLLLDKDERRLGDMAAGTIVIRERKTSLSTAQLKMVTAASIDTGLDVGRVTPAEYDLLVDFLRRRNSLARAHRPQVAMRMAEHFKEKLEGNGTAAPLIGASEGSDGPRKVVVVDNAEQYLESLYLTYQQRAAE
ncbi:MAG: RDD family protein [Cyanobacteria bacterium REEB67]|nr:RDD family protein [Cyanobacteria bacterium REEB67]